MWTLVLVFFPHSISVLAGFVCISFKISRPECPVCKGGVSESTLIPIFLRDNRNDPRAINMKNLPKRPGSQRIEATPVSQHIPRLAELNRQNAGNSEVNFDVIATTIELSKKIKNVFLFMAPAESEDWRYLIMHMRLWFLLVVVFFVIAGLDI